jgi:ABC-type cobalamin/Fe3+-siderophores transport system ATPase subunit
MEQTPMRTAKAQDIWRNAIKPRKIGYTINKLTVKNIKGIGDKEISFPTTINALCGENGVGKTTLLKTLYAALSPEKAAVLGIKLKPQNPEVVTSAICEITTKTEVSDGTKTKIVTETHSDKEKISKYFGDESDEPLISYIDAAAAVQRITYLLSQDADFGSVLESLPALLENIEAIQLRQEITGRAYAKVRTYEVDDYNGLPVFPYFVVTVGQTTYGSEGMGLGELCANYILWALSRCKDGTLILLEEPESHLPPRAQERLIAHVADQSVRKNFNIFVSTHSQHTLENFPVSHITFLGRLSDRSVIQRNPSIGILYESLRISSVSLCLVVVEDHSAFAFLKGIIEKLCPELLGRFDFTWKSGYSDIDEILSKIPHHKTGKITLLGVYDGDQRMESRPASIGWSFIYLPGTKDPADYMANAVKERTAEYATLLRRDVNTIELAVANIDAIDIKDFFLQLRKSINIDLQILYEVATELWLSYPKNLEIALQLVKELKEFAFKR